MKMIILVMYLMIKDMIKMIFLFNDYPMFILIMILNHVLLLLGKNIMNKKLVNMKIGKILLQVENQLQFQKNQKKENNKKKTN